MINIRIYEAWILDVGQTRDDARRIEAVDREDAASQCVERYEARTAEYAVGSGETVFTVAVALPGQPPENYTVAGDTRPHYYAMAARESV